MVIMETTAQLRERARKAEENCNWRMATILYTRAINAYPTTTGQLAKQDLLNLRNARTEARHQLHHICPVCGGSMRDILCPDDQSRTFCDHCKRTYTPMGYMEKDDYALKWFATTWTGTETSEVIEVQ